MTPAVVEPKPATPFATIPELLVWAAQRYGEAPFLVEPDGRRLSFLQLHDTVAQAAAGFVAAGVEVGDSVAVWAPNGGAWVVATLGLQNAGGVLVPINTRFKGAEAAFVLRRTRARVLCTVHGFLGADYVGMVSEAALPGLGAIVLLDDAVREGARTWTAFLAGGAEVTPAALEARRRAIGPHSPCDILFTSGATGEPKGAVHSHRQALTMPATLISVNGYRPGDRMLIVNPFFHSFGYRAGWMACLVGGLTAYPHAVFDIDAVLRTIQAERITVLPAPPAVFQALLDHPQRRLYDLSSLRSAQTGSANMAFDLVRRAFEELGLEVFLTSYGLTEATAMGTSCRIGQSLETIAGSVGRPFPGVELRIADPAGATLAPGQAGEVQLRGDNVMLGYFEDPEATAEAITPEGWLHTGDVGAVDEAGDLQILDRMKDVVIVGGFNAYPAEIERMLADLPVLAEAAVVGAPDPRLGEVCVLFAVLKPGGALTLEALTAWARPRMANYKVPRRLFVVEALPRTALGKVQKFLLRQRAAEAASAGSA